MTRPTLQSFRRSDSSAAVLGLGTAALGRPGYINVDHGEDLDGKTDQASMEANAHAVFDHAYAAGIRYFDAARSYGKAEAFLASWISARRPDGLFVASKWGYEYVADWKVDVDVHEVKDHSAATYRRQLEETLGLLGTSLGLYQIHSVTPDSPALDDDELLAGLAELKRSGVAVGLTTSGPSQAQVIRRTIDIHDPQGKRLFDSVQATWNLLETSAGDALADAARAGMVVVVKEALANGRLATSGSGESPTENAAGPDAVALAAAMHQPFASVVLSGAVTTAQLDSNLRATDVTSPPASTPVPPTEYWQRRSQLDWN